ncbi:MAG: prolyl oligopeptidase family serine peptidase [Phycisphaerae bacterium]|nr:prolyl oligopeptidase family serine peptidase [Phycisphaerae bacterium]
MAYVLCVLLLSQMASQPEAADVPESLRPFFAPPTQYAHDLGSYRSLLVFNDGTPVTTAADWHKRRAEIFATWRNLIGTWPPLIEKPKVQYLEQQHRENFTQHKVLVEIAPGGQTVAGYLLVPDEEGQGPANPIRNSQSAIGNQKGRLPAVLVVYYDPETGIGLGKELRDFAYQLAKRGFVTLSIGTPEFCSLKPPYKPLCETSAGRPQLQPLSALAYVAANCHTALANMPNVDPARIGVVGHSYGGKWAMFASCLYEKFACAVWSDPGIVFDEIRPNINYWEPWYLGWDATRQRERGVPGDSNPRTGPYKTMIETGRDLHELHALMAPRPFLVSGGAEDPPNRWQALNHTVAVNKLLGSINRVAMTNRPTHDPTPESNEQLYTFFEHVLKLASLTGSD